MFFYLVFMYFTVSSLIVSVLMDGWENSTIIILRKKEQKAELARLAQVQKDAQDYKMLK